MIKRGELRAESGTQSALNKCQILVNGYSLSTNYVPGLTLDSRDTLTSKINTKLCLPETYILMEERSIEQIF